jgi:hypothetical protein
MWINIENLINRKEINHRMQRKVVEYKGERYEMGLSIFDVRTGDIAQSEQGALEEVVSVTNSLTWEDVKIRTPNHIYSSFFPKKVKFGRRINSSSN